jgi:hypothetical protein
MARYEGRVRSARLGALGLEPGRVARPDALRDALGAPFWLRLEAEAGPQPRELAALFAIGDAEEKELLLLGVLGEDVVFSRRLRARVLGFDQPTLRAEGLLAGIEPGSAFALEVQSAAGRTCLARGEAERCFEPGVASGWSFWRGLPWLRARGRALLDLAWLGALLVPLGFWGVRPRPLVLGAGLVLAALVLAPLHPELRATSGPELAAAGAGLAAGAALRRGLRAPKGVAAP